MKRKLFSILTALALCLGLLPGTAWAEPAGTVTVLIYNTQGAPTELKSGKSYVPKEGGGVKERKDETDYLKFSGDTLTVVGTVSLPAANGPTLSINGGTLTITGEAGSSLILTGGSAPALSIASGSAVLGSKVGLTINTSSPASAFSTTKDYIGDIKITSTSADSPAVSGALTIQSAGNVTIENKQGMAVGGSLTIQKAGNVTIKSEQNIAVGGSLTIQQAGDVEISGGGSSPAIASNVDITSAGSIKLSSSSFIAVAGKLTIKDAASVEVSGGGSNNPAVQGGADITSAGDVTLTSDAYMAVNGGLTVKSGGNVTVSGGAENGPPALMGTISIMADGDISITDRKADSDYSGASLTSKNGEISVPGMVYYDGQLWKYGGEIKDGDPSGKNIDLILDAPTCYEVQDKSGNNAGCIYCTPAGDDGTPARLTLDNVRFDNELRVANEEGSVSIIEIKGNNSIKTLSYIGAFASASGAVLTGSGSFTGGIVAGSFTNESNVTLNAVVNTVTKDKGDSSKSTTYDATVYGNADTSMIYVPLVGSDVFVSSDDITHTTDYKLTITKGAALTVTAEDELFFYSFDEEYFTNNGAIINNGTIYLSDDAAEAEDIPAAIKALNLTGGGIVTVEVPDGDAACYTNSGEPLTVTTGDLDFSDPENLPENLPQGVTWKDNTLTLEGNVFIDGAVTLPGGEVNIVLDGESIIETLRFNEESAAQVTFSKPSETSGASKLTIKNQIGSSIEGESVTVDAGVTVNANGGINIGESGVDGLVTVNGTLTAAGNNQIDTAIYAGQVIVNGGGELNIIGKNGIALAGMKVRDDEGNITGGIDYTGALTVNDNGTVTARCENFIVSVDNTAGFPEETEAADIIKFPDGYLADGYELKMSENRQAISIEAGEGEFSISSANVPTRPSSGGGGSSTYPVRTETVKNGTVTVTPKNAAGGTTVTVVVTPDEGYELDGLTVTDSQGNEVALTGKGDGKYTFTMPGRAVTIKAAFAPSQDSPCDGGADCPSRAFSDLDAGKWYHEATDYVLRNGLMGGYGGNLFGPDNSITRAQFAQILYNKEGRPAAAGSNPFADVPDGKWYTPAILWAAENGVVNGYGNGLFGPDDSITREQLAVMLWRYAGSPAADKELNFKDADAVSGYALEAMRWAVENGILNGYGNGLLGPQGLATRAQVAQMLKNYMSKQLYM